VAQSYYARVPQLPEPIQRNLLELVERSKEILDFLQETTTEKPSATPAKFASLLGQRLSISVSEAQFTKRTPKPPTYRPGDWRSGQNFCVYRRSLASRGT
jgi:hypothetical protein